MTSHSPVHNAVNVMTLSFTLIYPSQMSLEI